MVNGNRPSGCNSQNSNQVHGLLHCQNSNRSAWTLDVCLDNALPLFAADNGSAAASGVCMKARCKPVSDPDLVLRFCSPANTGSPKRMILSHRMIDMISKRSSVKHDVPAVVMNTQSVLVADLVPTGCVLIWLVDGVRHSSSSESPLILHGPASIKHVSFTHKFNLYNACSRHHALLQGTDPGCALCTDQQPGRRATLTWLFYCDHVTPNARRPRTCALMIRALQGQTCA
jgi:hypothetical protein